MSVKPTEIIKVKTKPSYNISIGQNIVFNNILTDELQILINSVFKHFVLVIDSNIINNHNGLDAFILKSLPKGCQIDVINLTINEQLKTRDTKQKIEDELFKLGANRYTAIIAIGGGVLLDTVGFVAATFARGIPVVYVATTLLAMVDAAVGGKTGVNTEYGKNLIGAFKQPAAVIIDLNYIKSLSEQDYLSALAEVIKVAYILDRELFEYIEDNKEEILVRDNNVLKNIIKSAVLIKAKIVEQDECESGLRQLLNFGHTLGHAIEKHEEYLISHGFAVALGIWLESYIADKMGVLGNYEYNRLVILLKFIYKDKIVLKKNYSNSESIYNMLSFDKKTKNKQPRFILVNKIGGYHLENNEYSHEVDKKIVLDAIENIPSLSILRNNNG